MSGRITPAKTSGLSNKGSKWETSDSIPNGGSPVMDALPTVSPNPTKKDGGIIEF